MSAGNNKLNLFYSGLSTCAALACLLFIALILWKFSNFLPNPNSVISYKIVEHAKSEDFLVLKNHNAKSLSLESFVSNERKPGVVFRYDINDYMSAAKKQVRDGIDSTPNAMDNWRIAHIIAIPPNRSSASIKHVEMGSRLLRALSFNVMLPSDIFDADMMGKFIALGDLWQATDSLHWTNLRFYLNPYTLKLEPIFTYIPPYKVLPTKLSILDTDKNSFINFLFHDPKILAAYNKYIKKFSGKDYIAKLSSDIALDPALKDHLVIRSNILSMYPRRFVEMIPDERIPPTDHPESPLIYGHIQQKNDMLPYLEMINTSLKPIEIIRLSYSTDSLKDVSHFFDNYISYPIVLDPNQSDKAYISVRVNIPWELYKEARFFGEALVDGQIHKFTFRNYFDCLPDEIPKQNTLAEITTDYPYLEWDGIDSLSVKQGNHVIREPLELPEEIKINGNILPAPGLKINAGTELSFTSNSYIKMHGPLIINGEERKEVVLESYKGQRWKGILVINSDRPSKINHAIIQDLSPTSAKYLDLPSAITFYNSEVEITNSEFDKTEKNNLFDFFRSKAEYNNLEKLLVTGH